MFVLGTSDAGSNPVIPRRVFIPFIMLKTFFYILIILFTILLFFYIHFSKKIVNTVFVLNLVILNLGVMMWTLGLEFYSYILVIIYSGAVVVLFVFVVMMIRVKKKDAPIEDSDLFFEKKLNQIPTIRINPFVFFLFTFFTVILISLFLTQVFDSSLFLENSQKVSDLSLFWKNFNYKSLDIIAYGFYRSKVILFFFTAGILFIGLVGAISLVESKFSRIKRQ